MQATAVICPLCHDKVDKLLYRFHVEGESLVLQQIREQNPGWTTSDGLCSRCLDYYQVEIVMNQRVLPEIGPYFPVRTPDDFIVLPTPLRLDVDQRYTGKNITICFIDSGFYCHPDLVARDERIKTIVDIAGSKSHDSDSSKWHGTMTTVVCAGDGYLSKGLYKGIASDADLVLIRVQDGDNHITAASLIKALEWILDNYVEYNIRIVNTSLGVTASEHEQKGINDLVDSLTSKGIVIVAAAGNNENSAIQSPANSINVITVGGLNDNNDIERELLQLYHSSFRTDNQVVKPEIIAPAIWVAAPILPGTKEQVEAETLFGLLKMDDSSLAKSVQSVIDKTGLDATIIDINDPTLLRKSILDNIQRQKYISPHYMHVDGTSFAAPIISSIVAQMLEANPALTPALIRNILFSCAKRIPGLPAERQGFGIVDARKAIQKALKTTSDFMPSPSINADKHTIAFYVQHDCASQVALAGSFNHWSQHSLLMSPVRHGYWSIEMPLLPAGRYQYKFLIDDKDWMEDVNNPYREPDGFNGFNSILRIEPN